MQVIVATIAFGEYKCNQAAVPHLGATACGRIEEHSEGKACTYGVKSVAKANLIVRFRVQLKWQLSRPLRAATRDEDAFLTAAWTTVPTAVPDHEWALVCMSGRRTALSSQDARPMRGFLWRYWI
jgi:hypothetical protein